MISDVMVFVPVYRLEERTVKAVLSLEWEGPITHVFQRDNPTSSGKANHLHQYQRGRELFLKSQAEALLVIESDIVPPKDALKKLARLEADLAYGVYNFRCKHSETVNIFERYPDNSGQRARNPGESLSLHPDLLAMAIWNGKYDCSGGGLGCILIKRRVLEAIDFRSNDQANPRAFCDSFFTADAYAQGFSMQAEMSVVCDHIGEDGTVFHPELPGVIRSRPEFFPLGVNGEAWV